MINRTGCSKRGVWLAASSLVFLLSACNKETPKTSTQKLEATIQSIQRDFVNPTCVRCHTQATASNRYVSLVDISDVIEEPGHDHTGGRHERYLIKPGCPKQSFFLSILKAGKMPPSGKVSQDTLQTIERFITSLNPSAAKQCDDEPPDDRPNADEPGEA